MVRTVSVNLKSAKSPADNGRNKFCPLATGEGYVSRVVVVVNTNICSRDALHIRMYVCMYVCSSHVYVYVHACISLYTRTRTHERKSANLFRGKYDFQIIPRPNTDCPGFIRVLDAMEQEREENLTFPEPISRFRGKTGEFIARANEFPSIPFNASIFRAMGLKCCPRRIFRGGSVCAGRDRTRVKQSICCTQNPDSKADRIRKRAWTPDYSLTHTSPLTRT